MPDIPKNTEKNCPLGCGGGIHEKIMLRKIEERGGW
jgi:hypothetical protein